MASAGTSSVSIWTEEENQKFESALEEAMKSFDYEDYWNCVAREVGGGKSVEDVKEQFAKLKRDVKKIDDGRVPVPNYKPLSECLIAVAKARMSENDYEQK
ncbi:hypothetical protein AQUCO_01300851v1 [Aquilegia coerulea]|uniref:Uncharacterized protein n=1 Tax=Aquilegia coerulea TaxID=218851 RepID=A0A2G5E3W3_AQUCA|nr:hypothetical protein AQUCO_01300851v1 [Aquilegia coerulea]